MLSEHMRLNLAIVKCARESTKGDVCILGSRSTSIRRYSAERTTGTAFFKVLAAAHLEVKDEDDSPESSNCFPAADCCEYK